jgi:hypothetical protein
MDEVLSRSAQPAVAADRFAREIGAFLTRFVGARARQLNGNPLGFCRYPQLTQMRSSE